MKNQCKYCLEFFDFQKRGQMANHSRWCLQNPKRNEYLEKISNINSFIDSETRKGISKKVSEAWKSGKFNHVNWKKLATGRVLSEETKKKISQSMSLAQKEGRAWNIGKSRWNNQPSYPELFFSRFLEKNNIQFQKEFNIERFSIDFVILENRLAIEIDGKTHFTVEKVIESDKRKNLKLKEEGWKLLRIKWTTLFNDSKITIEKILEWIDNPTEYFEIY